MNAFGTAQLPFAQEKQLQNLIETTITDTKCTFINFLLSQYISKYKVIQAKWIKILIIIGLYLFIGI